MLYLDLEWRERQEIQSGGKSHRHFLVEMDCRKISYLSTRRVYVVTLRGLRILQDISCPLEAWERLLRRMDVLHYEFNSIFWP